MQLNEKEIKSLVSLVDDEDDISRNIVKDRILKIGEPAIPFIKEAIERSINPTETFTLKEIFKELNLRSTYDNLLIWKELNNSNLYQGLLILAKYNYPNLRAEVLTSEIEKIRKQLWLELNDNLTALEKVRVLNRIFFDFNGFDGDRENFFAPENSFINDVIFRKKGNPLMLSALYSIIAQSVNIPIYGINFPRHFMTVFIDKLIITNVGEVKEKDILFYINPFDRGDIYSLVEVRNFLLKMNIKPEPEHYLPCTNDVLVKRCINNLIQTYRNIEKNEIAENWQYLLTAFDN